MEKYIPFKFNIPIFILAFSLGFLYVYLFGPTHKVIIKYPTPFNANNLIYHDTTGDCYKYTPKKVECPDDPTKITEQPVA
jgi:hypothetical protein